MTVEPAGNPVGTVVVAGGGVYTVELELGRRVDAFLRGRLKKENGEGVDRVVVGDRVALSFEGDAAVIETVLPRRSLLVRRSRAGGRPRYVAANVDRMVVVMSVARPLLRRDLLDRFLVLAEASGMDALVVLNKIDLLDGDPDRPVAQRAELRPLEPLREVYHAVGYPTLLCSAVEPTGVEGLRGELAGITSVLAGPSGVGKSELLNALDPSLQRRTRPVSAKGRRGRHTTVNAQLLDVQGGGRVVDTPGFTDAGLWDVEPALLPSYFPELRERQDGCHFRSCSHIHEPGCAVLAALEAGAVDRERYDNYVALRSELEDAA